MAEPGEYLAVSQLLATVFFDDPMYAWLVPNRKRRMSAFTNMFVTGCELLSSANPAAVWITDDHAGAALWSPPGRGQLTFGQGMRMIGSLILDLRWGLFRQIEVENQLTSIKERHWYLNTIGVAAGRRGEGLGSALMSPMLERCDRDRLPIYLNTNTQENVAFYRKRGFEVIHETDVGRGRSHLWEMRRAPQTA